MLCKLVVSFRGGQFKTSGDGQFSDWKQILDFVHRKPNVIKFNQEITQLIHHMILSQEYLRQLKNNQLKNHINKLLKLQQQYFGLEPLQTIIAQYSHSKTMQSFVRLCYTVTRYVLYQTGMHDCICMHMPKESKEVIDWDTRSNNSHISGGKKRGQNKSQTKSALSQYFHKKEQRRKSQMISQPETIQGNLRTPTRMTDRESEISSHLVTNIQSHSGFKVMHITN